MPKIFISTSPFGKPDPAPLHALEKTGWEYMVNPLNRKLSPDEVSELAIDADGIIAGTENLHGLIEKSSRLKMISRVGIGLDSVPLAECDKRGITVSYTPDAVTMAVAELTIGTMICLTRQVLMSDRKLRKKQWERIMGRRLGESVIGLVGFGRIGSSVARLLLPFSPMKVLANDIQDKSSEIAKLRDTGLTIHEATKDEIYKISDIISLHVPYTPLTRNMVNSDTIKIMKKDAVVLNYSRGGIINETDLHAALSEGRIKGAAVDAFETEPYCGDLTTDENIIITPHIGSCSFDCRARMEIEATQDLIRFFKGEVLRNKVPIEEYEYQLESQ